MSPRILPATGSTLSVAGISSSCKGSQTHVCLVMAAIMRSEPGWQSGQGATDCLRAVSYSHAPSRRASLEGRQHKRGRGRPHCSRHGDVYTGQARCLGRCCCVLAPRCKRAALVLWTKIPFDSFITTLHGCRQRQSLRIKHDLQCHSVNESHDHGSCLGDVDGAEDALAQT
jgi:hypothetical protein